MSTLTLTAYSFTATLSRFGSGNFPRERIETADLTRTAYGSMNRRGTSYEPPHLWQVTAVVDLATAEILQSMHDLYQLTPGSVVVDDLIRPYTEPSPRTRALATSSPAAVTLGSNVRYYARFNAEFQGALTVEKLGNGWHKATFQLIETTKVAAA
ncbi:MAG: hypothetical protein KME14_20290 [Tildeniella torsiva UHER 1998/13D]|jgi:hypothetical protein|nr:hypothetical protein [Tildeniella torsiva UHER 1998/13D]